MVKPHRQLFPFIVDFKCLGRDKDFNPFPGKLFPGIAKLLKREFIGQQVSVLRVSNQNAHGDMASNFKYSFS